MSNLKLCIRRREIRLFYFQFEKYKDDVDQKRLSAVFVIKHNLDEEVRG